MIQTGDIGRAVSRLCNAMRLYAEQCIRFKALFSVDKEEAIDNLDRAFDAKLEHFHSLYDCLKANGVLNLFTHGDSAAIILVRNARHHDKEGLFQSWNSLMIKHSGLRRMQGASFLLVGYSLTGNDGQLSEYYVRRSDFEHLLKSSSPFVRKPEGIRTRLRQDLAFDLIDQHAQKQRFPQEQVFVNLVPIFMSAISRVFAHLRTQGFSPSGYDDRVYFEHFGPEPLVDLRSPVFKVIKALT